jgi:hypothetical protein
MDQNRYRHYANYKLKNVANVSSSCNPCLEIILCTLIILYCCLSSSKISRVTTSQLGSSWFVKGYKGVIYIAAISDVYPNDIVIECVDELYEIIVPVKRSSWGRSKKKGRQESMGWTKGAPLMPS